MINDTPVAPLQTFMPDLSVLRRSSKSLTHEAALLGDIYLGGLKEKLSALLIELSRTDEQILSTLTSTPVALKTSGLSTLIEDAIGIGASSDKGAADLLLALNQELKMQIELSRSSIAGQVQALDGNLVSFEAVDLNTAHLIVGLQADIDRLQVVLEAQQRESAGLLAQETAVNTLIAEVDKLNIVDKLRPLVESLNVLLEVDPKNPLAGSAKAGLAGIQNMLLLADESLKYKDLIELRERLQQQLDTMREKSQSEEKRIADDTYKVAQLQDFQGLAKTRDVYLQEVRKIIQTLTMFHEQGDPDTTDDTVKHALRFIENASTLVTYLTDLRRDWRADAAADQADPVV